MHFVRRPIAQLGYFQSEFVERRKWLNAESFAELVALAQSLRVRPAVRWDLQSVSCAPAGLVVWLRG
jgi:hypothetical protein